MHRKQFIISEIVKLAQSNFPESEIFLYGSRARNENRKESDWDLLVLLKENTLSFNKEREIINDFYELELKSGEVFSPLIYAKSEWEKNHLFTPLFENIKKEGIRIK